MSGREIHLQEKYERHQMRYRNLIQDMQIQFLDDLGFSECTASLHIVVIIFEEE